MTVINKNIIETPNPRSSNVVLIDTVGTDLETSYPNGVYAQLMYSVGSEITLNASNLSSIEMNTDELEDNTAYQNTPFSGQLSSVSNGSADQITSNAFRGWITVSVDTDGSDVVYVGDSGVTTTNGYKLSATNPTLTVSSDDLSEWYVTGAAGGEKLFILGAYFSG